MTDAGEMQRLAQEAADIIEEARRYLTQFGSVDAAALVHRIDVWRGDVVRARTRRAFTDESGVQQ